MNTIKLTALTIYLEARGEPIEGQIAVANVIRNRVKGKDWYGKGYKDVCLKRYGKYGQFSCWNNLKPKDAKIIDKISYGQCWWIAFCIIFNKFKDNTLGSTHYHNINVTPSWSKSITMIKCMQIGKHIFYKEL